jgi:Fe2+ or Zn2+ uptake regulation protein
MSRVLKHSKHRESILMLLKEINSHPTAEWLYTELKKYNQNISVATVYRNLNQLYEAGEIIKVDVGDGVEHYDAVTCDHCHFICECCREITDIDVPVSQLLNKDAEKHNDVLITRNSLVFYGLCSKCK